jgi:hypothetical protein
MLAMPPHPGTNTILITHQRNLFAALGKDWQDVKQGEASIFRPENGTYKLVARVQIDEWHRIANATKVDTLHWLKFRSSRRRDLTDSSHPRPQHRYSFSPVQTPLRTNVQLHASCDQMQRIERE